MHSKRLSLFGALAMSLVVLSSCGPSEKTVTTIGAVIPLTGSAGESYGIAAKNVIEYAVNEINEKWQSKNMRLEVVFADGKCTSGDARKAAIDLVENKNINVIYGGACSDETLGIAPFAEKNKVLLMTPLSGSSKITDAGDFIFRVIYNNRTTVDALSKFIKDEEYGKVALVTEDTSYAQDLRSIFLTNLKDIGTTISADEIIAKTLNNLTEQVQSVVASKPDAVVILPQTLQTAGLFAKALAEAKFDGQVIGNDVVALDVMLNEHKDYVEGYVASTAKFKGQGTERFASFQKAAGCDTGYYCATVYDGIMLLSEKLEKCGVNTECLRDALYATQNWAGTYYGTISFDENGDIGGAVQLNRISNGKRVAIQ